MIVLRRLSTGPTIPELLDAETEALLTLLQRRLVDAPCRWFFALVRSAPLRLLLSLVSLMLVVSLMLARLPGIGPAVAGGAFRVTTWLCSSRRRRWRPFSHASDQD